jgi:hypothetical protein
MIDFPDDPTGPPHDTSHAAKTEVTPRLDVKNQLLELFYLESMDDYVVNGYKEVVDFKEQVIRDALIALGWTPPDAEKTGKIQRMLAAMCGNCANSVRCKLPEYCEQRKAVIAAAGEAPHG